MRKEDQPDAHLFLINLFELNYALHYLISIPTDAHT